MIAVHAATGRTLADRVAVADAAGARAKGLLGREAMGDGEGLWIVPCPMVHTFFMKFPIDVLFLDRALTVRRVVEGLKPWRLSPWVLTAHSALELRGGVLRGAVRSGDRVEMRPA